jgi:retinol dehydrogenase 12
MSWNIEGKQVLVTGASRGIGRATVLALAKLGANLSLLVRDRERGEKVVEEARATGSKSRIDLFMADLSSLSEVRRVAREYLDKHDRLDVLINNAGAINMDREVTADGYERTFATNHLAYFLLTDILLDAIKKSAPSRIINVASEAHRSAKLDFDDLMQSKRSYAGFNQYCNSKLANILFTKELSKRLEGTNVTANSLHPGVIASGFGRNNKGMFGFIMRNLAGPFLGSEESGARTSVFLASSPDVEGKTGLYFKSSKESTPTKDARDEALATRLWTVSEELIAAASHTEDAAAQKTA